MANTTKYIFNFLLKEEPSAVARITGSNVYPKILGNCYFYDLKDSVIMTTFVKNLPATDTNIFAFHIHEGNSCDDNFEKVGQHLYPNYLPHPNHVGDLPPLFSINGTAWACVLLGRFSLQDILGRTIVIHLNPDDFTTQPSGNSGEKIACGKILPLNKK